MTALCISDGTTRITTPVEEFHKYANTPESNINDAEKSASSYYAMNHQIKTSSSIINKKHLRQTTWIKIIQIRITIEIMALVVLKISPGPPQLRIMALNMMGRRIEVFLQTWLWKYWRYLTDIIGRRTRPRARLCTE